MATSQPSERSLDHAFMLSGVIALIFGATLLFRHEEAMSVSALLLGLWWLTQAALVLFSTLVDRQDTIWKAALAGLGGIAGFAVLTDPVQTAAFLDSLLSVALGGIGVAIAGVAVFGGFRGGGMGSMLFGVVSGAIGALLLFYPEGSFTTLVTVVGVILVIHGVAAIVIAVNAG